MKTLIIHDRFQFRGGAERLVLDLARGLNADIVTEFWTEESFPQSEAPGKVFVLDRGEPRMMVWRYFRAQWNFWWKTRGLLNQYDVIIFSGNNCLSVALRPLAKQKVICYCHTPVRYVYDLLKERRAAEPAAWKRFFYYDVGKWLIRSIYRIGLSRMQVIVANSENVRDRLRVYCQTESKVIHPPIRTDLFHWIDQEPYYLSFARLDELKRIDRIVRAFQKLPDKRLIVASGGDAEQEIRTLAQGYPNIEIVGWVDDTRLKELIGRCIATIYIPLNEDFGMSPLEGMTAGKPCIGVDEGGLRETMIDGKTGVLIPQGCKVEDLIQAVEALTPTRALEMRAACEERAKQFDTPSFLEKMKQIIQET